MGNAEACGVPRSFGRGLHAAIRLVVVSALRHTSRMLEVEIKEHVYIRIEGLED
jgi:hypothetical protein